MKLKVLIAVLVFLILVNLATIGTFVYVQFTRKPVPPDRPWERMMGPSRVAPLSGRRGRMMRLPPKKRDKLRELLGEFREQTREARLRIRSMEARVFELMQEDSIQSARVDSLLEEIAKERLEMSRIAAKKLAESREFLAPEERRIFFKALRGDAPRPGGGHHRGGGRRGEGEMHREQKENER